MTRQNQSSNQEEEEWTISSGDSTSSSPMDPKLDSQIDKEVGEIETPNEDLKDASPPAYLLSAPDHEEPLNSDTALDISQIITQRSRGCIETCDPRLSDPKILYEFLRHQALIPPTISIRCVGISYIKSRIIKREIEICKRCEEWDGHLCKRCERDWDGQRSCKSCKENLAEHHCYTRCEKGNLENCDRKRHHSRSQKKITSSAPKRIVDFDFTIDLTGIINHPQNQSQITLFTPCPSQPVYRGSHWRRFAIRSQMTSSTSSLSSRDGLTKPGRSLSWKEDNLWDQWEIYRKSKGIPGWVKMESIPEFWNKHGTPHPPTNSLKKAKEEKGEQEDEQARFFDWCQAFCNDHGLLKEFWLTKEISGWDFGILKKAIRDTIQSTGYQGEGKEIEVSLNIDPKYVVIRSDNRLSRILSNPFTYFLSWISGIYPLFHIFKCCFPRFGGAPWKVAFVDYSLKRYIQPHSDDTSNSNPNPNTNSGFSQLPPISSYRLIGMKEGEWFKQWEHKIKLGVQKKFKGVLDDAIKVDNLAAVNLDGY